MYFIKEKLLKILQKVRNVGDESMGPGQDGVATSGSAVRLASVARHVTHCATLPAILAYVISTRPEVIKLFLCSTQLTRNFNSS